MTVTAERLNAFLLVNYILPARSRGEDMVIISVREVWKKSKGKHPLGLIRGVLGSMAFRNAYRMALIEENPGEAVPDSFVFKFLERTRSAGAP